MNKKILLAAAIVPIAIAMKKGGFYFAWGSAVPKNVV